MTLGRSRKKWIVAGAAFIVLVLTLGYILRFTPLVPDQVARAFTENLLRERGYRLQIATVRGNPLGDLVLHETRLLDVRDGEREVARVREIHVRVHPLNLLRGRVDVRWLHLVEPSVHVGGAGIGEDLFASSSAAPRAPMPLVRIRNLEIEDGHVAWERDSTRVVRVQSLNGSFGFSMDSRHMRVRIERLRAQASPYADLDELRGVFEWSGDSLLCEDVHLATATSRLSADGTWTPARRHMTWVGTAAPLQLDELQAFFEVPVEGRLHGPFELSVRGSEVDFAGTWSGSYGEHAVRDTQLELHAAPDLFELRRARGWVAEQALDLQLRQAGDRLEGTLHLTELDCSALDPDWPRTRIAGRVGFRRARTAAPWELDVELHEARVDDWALAGVQARATFSEGNLDVEDGVVRSVDAEARFSGALRDRDLDFEWSLQAADVSGLFEALGVEDLRGRAEAEGDLGGSLDAPSLSAHGTFAATSVGALQAARGEFDLEAPDLRGDAPLSCALRGEELQLAGRTFSRFTSQLERSADGALHVRRAEASRGDTLVALVAALRSLPTDWSGQTRTAQQLRLETALVQAGVQEIRVEDPATLWWSDRRVRIDSLRVVTRGGSLRLDGALDLDAGLIDARTEVSAFDLDFVSRAARLDSALAGVATGWIEAHGSLDRTLLDGRVDVHAGHWRTLPFDSVGVQLQSDAFGVELRALDVRTPHGRLRGHARLAYLPGLQRWLVAQQGARSRDELEDAQVSAELRVESLALERFWEVVRPGSPPDWVAEVDAQAELSGSVAAPRLAGSGQARTLRFRGYEVDSLRFEARYADGVLGVAELEVDAAGAQLQARGRVPVRVHLMERASLQRDAALEAHLRIDDGSFAVVPRFISFFEPATRDVPVGRVRARLDVTGTPRAPQLRGDLAITGAGFTLADLEEIYRDVHATGVFEGSTLRLDGLRARTGRQGRVQGNGYVVFDGFTVSDYRFALSAHQVPIFSVPQIAATVAGNIQVRARRFDNGVMVPAFAGSLQIVEASITQEFAGGDGEPAEVLEATDQPDWLADVTLDAPGRVWVKNSNADAELSGTVQLVRDRTGLDVQGEARVKRGRYTVYLERFEITRGTLDFSRHPGWEPELDLEAQRGRIGDRIYVQLTGTPSAPNLSFTGDAPGTAAEYQDRLIGGDRDLASDAASVASAVAAQALADLEYIDTFSINPDAAGASNASSDVRSYNVSAGWEVSDRVFVTYTQGINQSDLKQSVSIELDLLRSLLLESSWERRNFPTLENQPDATQDAFDLDLKFRWEY